MRPAGAYPKRGDGGNTWVTWKIRERRKFLVFGPQESRFCNKRLKMRRQRPL